MNSGEVVGQPGDVRDRRCRERRGAARAGGRPGEVLLGETTCRLVRDAVRVEPVEPLAAKGKSEPLAAYRLLEVERRAAASQVGRRRSSGAARSSRCSSGSSSARSRARRCRLVTVVGEPGVGQVAARRGAGRARIGPRARVVRGACLSYGEGITFWAVAQIVRELAGIRDEHSARGRRRGATACAPLSRAAARARRGDDDRRADRAGDRGRSSRPRRREQPLVLSRRRHPLGRAGAARPARRLPALIGDAPLLVLCLARPELLERRPDWPVTVRLEPLGAAEVDALLEQLEAPAGGARAARADRRPATRSSPRSSSPGCARAASSTSCRRL